jgi:hypothetical protein
MAYSESKLKKSIRASARVLGCIQNVSNAPLLGLLAAPSLAGPALVCRVRNL